MSTEITNLLKEITKIPNYTIPIFGAVVTVAIALGPIGQETTKGPTIIVSFAIYTLFSAFVSYSHRLSYKRYLRAKEKKQEKKKEGEKRSNLPLWAVIIFMGLHLFLIFCLSWFLLTHVVFDC